jgi:predicted GIY-YIG superfamily endonuclease
MALLPFCPYDRDFAGLPWSRWKHHEWKVYVLVDPRDDTVRYVGITRDPDKRRAQHRSPSAANWRMAEWKLELAKAGKRPLMAVVDSAPSGRHLLREAQWMRYYRKRGFGLLNQSMGRRQLILRATQPRSVPVGTLGTPVGERRRA